jgi:hypothetical protein
VQGRCVENIQEIAPKKYLRMGMQCHVIGRVGNNNNMLKDNVMYCLLKYQVANSGLLHIVVKFYLNLMLLSPSEIHTLQFHRIGNGSLVDTWTSKFGTRLAPLLWFGKPGSQRKYINHTNKFFTLLDVHTHTPVKCVRSHWEYPCNSMTYYTPHRSMVTLQSIRIDEF